MTHPIGLGVIGMGRAFTLMLPTWTSDPRICLIAAHDPRPSACLAFEETLGGVACQLPEEVCAHPDVEWVYIASPHNMHVEHVLLAARYRKHVLVEKPMALNMADCEAMIKACQQAGTYLVIGHSHSFDAPVRLAPGAAIHRLPLPPTPT
jgi:phthalate 4,5-cis-dihydrodiol dehydrogenase